MLLARLASFAVGRQLCPPITTTSCAVRLVSKSLSHIDHSRVPRLNEADLDEQFVRGSGPGGQVVNKTANAVVLRHVPTNLVVKCHAGRALDQNRKEARRLMVQRLDNHYNGDQSVEQQMLRLQRGKSAEQTRRRRKVDEMKRAWREREGLDTKDDGGTDK